MAERKTLLKRYGIPLNHLDFEYVKKCNDPREMERIVHVLQSGEEGYYPDLTKCAEDKLRLLKPNSRLFRCEVQLIRSDDVCENDLKPIKEFSRKVREMDKQLATLEEDNVGLAPIRNFGKINLNSKDKDENSSDAPTGNQMNTASANHDSGTKTASTDYRKWDRYDPDVEILRMDLAEERAQEDIERKNRLNAKNFSHTPLIEEIKEEDERMKKLTDIERDNLADEYRLRGNEYFRAKEYDSALTEYTRTIRLNPEKDTAAYNNRALTYMKLKKYSEAIKDCQKCISIEPNNIKANYRLAQSNLESGNKEKALEMFEKVLQLDPTNESAKNFSKTLREQISEPVPSNATRLRIEEGPTQSNSPAKPKIKISKTSSKKNIETNTQKIKADLKASEPKNQDYDLASLVRPKEILPNKLMDTAANMVDKNNVNMDENKKKSSTEIKTKTSFADTGEKNMELRLPMLNETTSTKNSKPLIEEL